MCMKGWAKSKPQLLRGGLGDGWYASDRSWLMEGVSPSGVLVPAQSKSRRLAANACWAACVRMADQRERREASTALRRMLGTALAFVWAKRRRKVAPAPCLEGEDHEPAPSGTEKFWVCAFLGFACVLERCSCVLAGTSSGLAG